jgi:hypothetical protein
VPETPAAPFFLLSAQVISGFSGRMCPTIEIQIHLLRLIDDFLTA